MDEIEWQVKIEGTYSLNISTKEIENGNYQSTSGDISQGCITKSNVSEKGVKRKMLPTLVIRTQSIDRQIHN